MKPNIKFLLKVAAGEVRLECRYSQKYGGSFKFIGGEKTAKIHADAGLMKMPYVGRASLGRPDHAELTEAGLALLRQESAKTPDPWGHPDRLPDATPENPGEHKDVVGHEFAGHDYQDKMHHGKRWFCESHDAEGYWMYATDGSGHWTNVSERAINRSFHRIHVEGPHLYCGWYNSGVPKYTNQPFVRHKDVTVTP